MFNPAGFSQTIFKDRYAFTESETWNEACSRVAKQMSVAEQPDKQKVYEEKFNQILVDNLFVPGGRIWYNSGRNNPQLLNCFVLSDQLDSKHGWGKLSNDIIISSMTGGGNGVDFSDVRPNGASIQGHRGICPGPVSLMRLIDSCGQEVKGGGGRRAAFMFSLDMDHPDILEFLDAKLVKGQLTNANVSVRSKKTTDFIKAIENGSSWELSWKGKYKNKTDAEELWNKIVTNAYNRAEPGFLNMELAESESNIWYIENLVTTNPCFSGEMYLKTEEGFKTFKSLSGQSLNLINHKGCIVKGKVWSTGVKKTVNIKFTSGEIINCTSNHKFMLTDGTECQAENLKDKRIYPYFNINLKNDEFTKLGFIQGDGCISRLNSKEHKGIDINIGENDRDIASLFGIEYTEGVRVYYEVGYNDILEDLKFDKKVLPERRLPQTFNNWTNQQKKSFMRGLYSANGSVIKNGRVSFKSTCFDLIEEIKSFLNEIGINSYITTNKPKIVEFNNGSYLCKQSYDLNIGTFEGIVSFANQIGFVHKYKNNELIQIIKDKSPLVVSVKDAEEKEVFDFNLDDDTHWGVVSQKETGNGYIAHNCGEIVMSSYDCCCLGHLVLHRFVKGKDLDWHELANTVRTGIRFLDNVLDVNYYPLHEMKLKSQKLRRIGLGTTGLADTLAMLGHKYGSEEGNKFIEKLYKFIAKTSYEASVMLAVEKGMFPACIPGKHIESGFMKRMPAKIKSLVAEHGIRNCCLLTQAPTGTVSILSGNCSSGIEPMFAPAYERRYWDNNVRKSELVLHPLFEQFMKEGKDVSHFVGSHELTVRDHMEVQKIIQKWVDNAVSKTINMPNNYPMEDMATLWLEYLPYLKGTTFYRDGTRGYEKADGTMEEPPLKPISIDEAKQRFNEIHSTGSEKVEECPSGICSL
jgi:ribonucleoside-diphosphate reductase alpha chain